MSETKIIGHMVAVPVCLTVVVRGSETEEQAIAAAEKFFAFHLERIADDNEGIGWLVEGRKISEASLEKNPEDGPSMVIDTLTIVNGKEIWSEDVEGEDA
jgi:hypothetical protein